MDLGDGHHGGDVPSLSRHMEGHMIPPHDSPQAVLTWTPAEEAASSFVHSAATTFLFRTRFIQGCGFRDGTYPTHKAEKQGPAHPCSACLPR